MNGYAASTWQRPEHLFDQVVEVRRADVPEFAIGPLKFFKIADLFTGEEEIFLGFGEPNAYLVVPDAQGGYQKFAGKSLRLEPSSIEDTRGTVQSGILFRFRNLPDSAVSRIRDAMKLHDGGRYWTCVNACSRILEDAGFSFANTSSLKNMYLPYQLLKNILSSGLYFDKERVEIEIVFTGKKNLEHYVRRIILAETMTICRHLDRRLHLVAKRNKAAKLLEKLRRLPERLLMKNNLTCSAPLIVAPVPHSLNDKKNIHLRISKPSIVGTLLRQVWGSHALFEAQPMEVAATDYLSIPLEPFPDNKPSFQAQLKKRLLFARPVTSGIRRVLSPDYFDLRMRSERDIYQMLGTNTAEQQHKYNFVITDEKLVIARINVQSKLVDWILSKHVLMTNYTECLFAGELWKDPAGTIHVSNNSGTYKPGRLELHAAMEYLQAVFPSGNFTSEPA